MSVRTSFQSELLLLQGTFLKYDHSLFSCFLNFFVVSNKCKQCKDCISLDYPKWNDFSRLIMLSQPTMRCCRHWVSSCGISAQDIALFNLVVFILFCSWQICCTFIDNKEFIIQQPKNEEISLNPYQVIFLIKTIDWSQKSTFASCFPDRREQEQVLLHLQFIVALLLWLKLNMLIYFF